MSRSRPAASAVFTNSVLFQPRRGFFRQIPGRSTRGTRLCSTLAPDSDYPLAERRLMAAVESVFGEHPRSPLNASTTTPAAPPRQSTLDLPKPEGRLRLVDAGQPPRVTRLKRDAPRRSTTA